MKKGIAEEEWNIYQYWKQNNVGISAKEYAKEFDVSHSSALSKLNGSVKTNRLYRENDYIKHIRRYLYFPSNELIKRMEDLREDAKEDETE